MRAFMARLRGPRATVVALPPLTDLELDRLTAHLTLDDDPRPYSDAVYEAFEQCVKLGLDVDPNADYDASELIRYVYAQGWLACETRLASPNMADAIDLAITTPAAVVERRPGQSDHGWTIHAIQQTVAHGVKSEQT